jgi:hypothetical protein
MRRPRAAGLLAELAILGIGGLAALSLGGPASADAAPYSDLASNGTIALCDAAGNRVTSGSIDDKPFVIKASSSRAAPAPFNGEGRTAVLLAYQPRQNAYPDTWSGDILTGTAQYTDPAHPMAAATPLDFTLDDYLKEFPASWDGYVQLRMYFGARGHGVDNTSYPTTDIKVTGKTWTVVRGGQGDCKAGTATSNEVAIAHLPGSSAKPTGTRGTATASPGSTSSAAPSTVVTSGSGPAVVAGSGGDPSADLTPTGGSGPPAWVAALVGFGLLAVAGLLVYVRRGSYRNESGE